MDLKEVEVLADGVSAHWYYRSKAKAMMRFLESVEAPTGVLDVGAGSGFFSKYLLSSSVANRAWCVDISYESESDMEIDGKSLYFRRSIDSVDANVLLLMDVLEHVEDDVGLLRSYIDKVEKGAKILISVPAFQFLWSAHDEFLEHKRRYTLNEVESVVRNAGLHPIQGSYYFGLVFPVAASIRLIGRFLLASRNNKKSQLSTHHPVVDALLGWLCRVELSFMKFNRLMGLTVFYLAEKR